MRGSRRTAGRLGGRGRLLVGLAGAVLTGIGDVLFLGRPVSGPAFDRAEGVVPDSAAVDPRWQSLWNGAVLSERRVRAGTLIGLVGTGLLGVGMDAAGRTVQPGAPRRAATVSAATFAVSGAGIHLFCGAVILAYRRTLTRPAPSSASPEPAPTTALAVSTVVALGALAALSADLTVAAVRSGASTPVRAALRTPFPWVAATLATFGRLPAPIGGYLRPASMSTGLLAYFALAAARNARRS